MIEVSKVLINNFPWYSLICHAYTLKGLLKPEFKPDKLLSLVPLDGFEGSIALPPITNCQLSLGAILIMSHPIGATQAKGSLLVALT